MLFRSAEVCEIEGGHALVLHGAGHGIWPLPEMAGFVIQCRYRAHEGIGEIVLVGSGEPPNHREYQLLMTPDEMELSRRIGDRAEALGYTGYELRPGQWFDIAVSLTGNLLTVTINGETVISGEDPEPLVGGTFAFGCLEGEGNAFDDIKVAGTGVGD